MLFMSISFLPEHDIRFSLQTNGFNAQSRILYVLEVCT